MISRRQIEWRPNKYQPTEKIIELLSERRLGRNSKQRRKGENVLNYPTCEFCPLNKNDWRKKICHCGEEKETKVLWITHIYYKTRGRLFGSKVFCFLTLTTTTPFATSSRQPVSTATSACSLLQTMSNQCFDMVHIQIQLQHRRIP